jgi:bacillithiol biosynthesis deacetylase BshB1
MTMVISAHPDDAEVGMGGTIAKLRQQDHAVLLVDLTDGEPARHGERGERRKQAQRAAELLGVERIILEGQDRFLTDTPERRLAVARLLREHRPSRVFTTTGACIHPDHAAIGRIVEAAVFYARLPKWEEIPGGEALADTEPWEVGRLFYHHCRMEPLWTTFDFAVDVSDVYEQKLATLQVYESVFAPRGELVARFQAEDQYMGSLLGVRYAEIFRSHQPLLVRDVTVFEAVKYG